MDTDSPFITNTNSTNQFTYISARDKISLYRSPDQMVLWGAVGLSVWFVIVVFHDHTLLLFFMV